MRNNLLNLALGALIALPVSVTAVAQDNAAPPQPAQPQQQEQGVRGPGRMDPDRMLQRMTRELNLTADQQAQIKPILAEHQQKVQALMQDQSAPGADRQAKMKEMREDMHSKIAAVLDDQQKQKFEAMQQRMHRGGAGGPPPPPPSL